MKHKIIIPNSFKPTFNHKFFLDTNVWFYLQFPDLSDVDDRIIRKYTEIYEAILSKDCLIETNSLQVAELVNLFLYTDLKNYNKKNKTRLIFKDYIKSDAGNKSREEAHLLINSITKNTTVRSGNLSEEELRKIISNIDKADFNDLCFARLCEKEGIYLVTHDFDFNAIETPLKIVSANKKYWEED